MPHPGRRGAGHHGRGRTFHPGRRPWGLRRRLTFAFAFVALAAVGLTTWLTLGAVFEAQHALFGGGPGAEERVQAPPSAAQRPAGAQPEGWEEHRFGPPWWLGGDAAPRWFDDSAEGVDAGGPPWTDPEFAVAREAFFGVSRTAFLAAVISFLLAVVAAAFVTRRITRPLTALTRGAERLGAGERGIRLDLPPSRDELRRLTEAFNDLVAGLERQEAWRRDMVADVAHDLRTPLSVLRSEIEAMQDGVTRVDAHGLDRLHGEVMMMARLVADLRDLSLAESGALELDRQETQLAPFLHDVAASFALRAGRAGTEVRVVDTPNDLCAEIDRLRLRQLLANLVDNAIRHAGSGPIELSAAERERGVTIRVRDHGAGLSDEAIGRIFERFYRLDPSRSRTGSDSTGSGLGLAIAKALAEAHGGRIEAGNHPEGGAVFSVWLPAREEVEHD
ncbi:MAG TPA: ATP-binding protein [Trueperaceae bacterium]